MSPPLVRIEFPHFPGIFTFNVSLKTQYSRREMISLSAGSLLALGLWPGSLPAEEAAGSDFSFVALNDLHYATPNCGPWFEKVLASIKSTPQKLDFGLIVGDLANSGEREQLGAIRDLFRPLGIPLHHVVGNHDYAGPDDRQSYEELYPRQINYAFEHKGWQFFGLDSTQGQLASRTVVSPSTLQWLDDSLPKFKRKVPTVVFTHFPMGPLVPSRPLNADDLLDRFRGFNLQAVLCGHFHGSTQRQVRGAMITTNQCCSFVRNNHDGTKEKGYFLCRAEDGKIRRTFVEVTLS